MTVASSWTGARACVVVQGSPTVAGPEMQLLMLPGRSNPVGPPRLVLEVGT